MEIGSRFKDGRNRMSQVLMFWSDAQVKWSENSPAEWKEKVYSTASN